MRANARILENSREVSRETYLLVIYACSVTFIYMILSGAIPHVPASRDVTDKGL